MRPYYPPAPSALYAVQVAGLAFNVHATALRQAFWKRLAAGQWEPRTFDVYRRFLDRGASCIDVGAWIGPTVLFGAHLARHVHAVEPDPVAFGELRTNVQANPQLLRRIGLHQQCIAAQPGPVSLYAGGMYWGRHSLFGDSMSSMLPVAGGSGQPSYQVAGICLEDFIASNGITDCNFIKMDVEGGEYALVPGRWHRLAAHGMPTLFISFHAPAPELRERMLGACLEELQGCYRHFYAADGKDLADLQTLAASVRDWGDEAAGSPWRVLERLLGEGLVATNQVW